MSIPISSVGNNQVFGTWLVRFNQLTAIISSNTVTADSTANGSITTGNSGVNGFFSAVTLSTHSFGGGTNQTPANLAVTTNTTFFYSITPIANITGNSTGTIINLTPNNLIIGSSVIISGNTNFSNAMNVNNTITSINYVSGNSTVNSTAIAFSSATSVNSSLNAISLNFGNSLINTSVNSTAILVSSIVNNTVGQSLTQITAYSNVALGSLNAVAFSISGVVDGGAQTASIGITNYANGSGGGGNFVTQFSRGSSLTPLFANGGDIIGRLSFSTWNGISFSPVAKITASMGTGVVNSLSLQSTLSFQTVAPLSNVLVTALTLDSNQNGIFSNNLVVTGAANVTGNLNVTGALNLSPTSLPNLSFGNSTINSSINSTSLLFNDTIPNTDITVTVNNSQISWNGVLSNNNYSTPLYIYLNVGNNTLNSLARGIISIVTDGGVNNAPYTAINYANTALGGGLLNLSFARGSQASPLIANGGDRTGAINYYGWNGTIFQPSSKIESFYDVGVINATSSPSSLRFSTTANLSSSPIVGMTLDSNQNLTVTNSVFADNLSVTNAAYITNVLYLTGSNEVLTISNIPLNDIGIFFNSGITTRYYPIYFDSVGTTVGYIQANSTSILYVTSSDRKYKTIHGDYNTESLLDNINKIKIYDAHFTADPSTRRAMVIADEVEKTHSHVVAAKVEGKPQGIDYGMFAVDLIGSIQTLTSKITNLEERIKELENK